MTAEGLLDVFRQAYANEDLLKVTSEIPQVSSVQDSPNVHIGGFAVDKRNASQGSLVVVLDNLLKGAASQAMQNLNLALGLDENSGVRDA